ncbi:uncharacterized protein LOC106179609 isoform X1 [Lingula anatina]|uniref:Uncharacterized protein LOC106179609 isoform X1 n=1 Tax=Lingula anatina TaxID=7574 RepID=A0A1S3K8F3_LINAN|nr:uncharacterized protein LOC106179609 isoform X1 [Lingula anatina]|eukprot:XP_013418777.2 uncharacterized protein LOC106179609 isoform X1 [Lingula anatina]
MIPFSTCVLFCVILRADTSLAQIRVTVQQGDINGKTSILGLDVISYLGIPYAEPPLGDLRFKRPVPKAAWSSPLNATEYGPICLQMNARFPSSEDCLTLNVHVPQNNNTAPKAVMVWVHGGGFVLGSGREVDPIGLALADVITVSINYRLGMFGFLTIGDDVKGNFGLWDQHLAFRWIKENIDAFGGDPNRITIFGESAGGMSVSFHAMSPMSNGLFHRVISQSGVGSQQLTLQKSTKNVVSLSENSKCNTTDSVSLLVCLKGKSGQDLLAISNMLIELLMWVPNMDNELITGNVESSANLLPDQYGNLDYLMGSNSLDGNALIRVPAEAENGFTEQAFRQRVDQMLTGRLDKDIVQTALIQEYTADVFYPDNKTRVKQFVEMGGDLTLTIPTHMNALKHDETNGTGFTFVYFLSINTCHKLLPTVSWLDGAGHADDLIYINGLVSVLCNGSATPADFALQNAMITYWTNFAKSGNPNLPASVLTQWPKYDHVQREYLDLNENITAKSNLKARRVAFMTDVLQKLVELPSEGVCTETGDAMDDLVVNTFYGKIRGKREVVKEWYWEMFLGVPYAAPPIGEHRFLPPIPPKMWSGIRNATELGYSCHGGAVFLSPSPLKFHEDCLTLNIYVPAGVRMWKDEKLAVMLFIHGGGYVVGSSSEYDGRALSWYGRVIVVTINYRLGIFGFASTGDQNAPGNVGLMDQSLAMRWVKQNIASFGGDPERITIFGESAGAGSVIYQMLSPMSKGLFKRAIAESTWMGAWDLHFIDPAKKNNIDMIREYGIHFNCSSSSVDMIRCLRDINASDIAQYASANMFSLPLKLFTPTVDREFMPYSPSETFDLLLKYKDMIKEDDMVDLLIGTNSGEGLTESFGAILTTFPNGSQTTNGLTEKEFDQIMKAYVTPSVGNNLEIIIPMIQNAYTNLESPDNPMRRLRAFQDVIRDITYVAGSDLAAQVHSTLGGNTYVYRFAHEPSFGHLFLGTYGLPTEPIYGLADHGEELTYVFGQPLFTDVVPMNVSSRDVEVSRQMIAYWSNFARYGSPNGPTVPVFWPQYETSMTSYMYIGNETEVKQNLGGSRVQLLKNVVRRLADSGNCPATSKTMYTPAPSNGSWIMQYIMPDQPEVNTRVGRVRGLALRASAFTGGKDLNLFLGIPYAKPPTGDRRFKKPEPSTAWTETLNATMSAPPCLQLPSDFMMVLGLNHTSEDCLYVSVVVPRGTVVNDKKPVVALIHGGFFINGSPDEHSLGIFSSLGDVITVSINYRLGMLGFMSTGDDTLKGNLGLYDMVAATKWIKENIASFGGNPDKITLFGTGSAGLAVLNMMVSPMAKDYFHQAVITGPTTPYAAQTPAALAEISRNFSAGIGCRQESSSELIECLRSKPADAFIYKGNPYLANHVFLVTDGELIKSDLVTAYTTSTQLKPLVIGSTSDYAGIFLQQYLGYRDSMTQQEVDASIDMTIEAVFPKSGMKDLLKAMIKQQFFSSEIKNDKDRLMALLHFYNSMHKYGWLYMLGVGHASHGGDVYMYEFNHRPQWSWYPEWIGATFRDDIGFLEGLPFDKPLLAELSLSVTDREEMISGALMSYIGNFVGTSNPNQGNFPVSVEWPKFGADDPNYLLAGLRFIAADMRDMMGQEQIRFWHGEGKNNSILDQVATMKMDAQTMSTSAPTMPPAATCPPALGSSDFLNSMNLGVKGVEDLVLALIVIASALGLFLIIAVGYVCVLNGRVGKLKQAAYSTSKTELTKM